MYTQIMKYKAIRAKETNFLRIEESPRTDRIRHEMFRQLFKITFIEDKTFEGQLMWL